MKEHVKERLRKYWERQKTGLKVCPFCGSNVALMWFDNEHQNEKRWEPCDDERGLVFPYVHCSGCDGTFYFAETTGSKVAEAWNRRVTDAGTD